MNVIVQVFLLFEYQRADLLCVFFPQEMLLLVVVIHLLAHHLVIAVEREDVALELFEVALGRAVGGDGDDYLDPPREDSMRL